MTFHWNVILRGVTTGESRGRPDSLRRWLVTVLAVVATFLYAALPASAQQLERADPSVRVPPPDPSDHCIGRFLSPLEAMAGGVAPKAGSAWTDRVARAGALLRRSFGSSAPVVVDV